LAKLIAGRTRDGSATRIPTTGIARGDASLREAPAKTLRETMVTVTVR